MAVKVNRAVVAAELRKAGMKRGHQIGQEVVNEARARCPVDEGRLRASIDYTVTPSGDSVKVVVGTPLDYGRYLHEGTGIHGPKGTPIVPVTREALKFKWEGATPATGSKDKRPWRFAKSVKGVKPNPFLANALTAVMGNIVRRRNP